MRKYRNIQLENENYIDLFIKYFLLCLMYSNNQNYWFINNK